MDAEDFARWTYELVGQGRLTGGQAADAREQRARFDSERSMIEEEFAGLIVAYVGGERVVGASTPEVLTAAEEMFGRSRQVYFEPIASNPVEADEIDAAMTPFIDTHLEVQRKTAEPVFASASGWLFAALAILVLLPILGLLIGSMFWRTLFLGAGAAVAIVFFGARALVERRRARSRARREEAEREKADSGS
jgi:hypothetical protein